MAEPSPIARLIVLCGDTDRAAVELYSLIADIISDKNLSVFWREMVAEEEMHVIFWNGLQKLAHRGDIPELFHDSKKLIYELEQTLDQIKPLKNIFSTKPDPSTAFLITFQMEFYLLQPCFAEMFAYAAALPRLTPILSSYDNHLNKLLSTFNSYGDTNAELNLFARAINNLWKQNRRLAYVSTIDELTGVLNRRGFFNVARPMIFMAQRTMQHIGVLMADIDDFKKINDTYGHQTGDRILKAIGTAFQESIRTSDIVGRYGGEEFIVLFSGIQQNVLHDMTEKIREAVARVTQPIVPTTISIGVAETKIGDAVDDDFVRLIRLADERLFIAKQQGKNRVVF